MSKKVWVIKVDTESGYLGFSGYFTTKPTNSQVKKYLQEYWPDDFKAGEANTAYPEVIELLRQVKV